VDEQPTGKLIAVQIKTGPSHFAEIDDSYIFRGKLTHLDYWTNHLPKSLDKERISPLPSTFMRPFNPAIDG
jgi:Domain of unknown function (DUF4365)